MKLNQRDKLILIVVLVVIIWVGGIMFFIKPAIDNVNQASSELDSKEMELASLQQQIKDDENLPQEVSDAYKKAIDTVDVFYDKMKQHEAMTEVQTQLDVNGDGEQEIKNLNLEISTISVMTLNRYVYNMSNKETSIDKIINDANGSVAEEVATAAVADLSKYSMSFTFTATKADLMQFIENLQTNTHRSLLVSELTIADVAENEDDTEWAGTMSLDFIMVPRLEDPQKVNDNVKTVDAKEE